MDSDKGFEVAPTFETDARSREARLLINIAEPDPDYQPFLLTDEASLLDAVGTDPEEIRRRLYLYLGAIDFDISIPIWKLVDRIKDKLPGWPEE